jgi:phosphoglycerate dehydrogenase-like enzyme
MSWKILVTARTISEVGREAVDFLRQAGCEVVIPQKLGPLRAEELTAQLAGFDAALVSPDQFTAEVLASPALSQLKIISRWGVGYDSIDVAAATRLGIVVAYTPGFLNETVADYTFALLLSLARRVHDAHAMMSGGTWKLLWGVDVFGKTVGLIGCGRIGQAVARRAAGFNLRLLAYDVAPNPAAEKIGVRFVPLDELLGRSDFVSLHCALTPENHGFFNEAIFRKMKPGALLVNTARGALINEGDLARALVEGRLGGAALDVFTQEPLPAVHPLRGVPNLLLSPHQAPCARETGQRVSMAAARAIVDLMQGRRPELVVDRAVFDSPALRARLS